MIDAWDYVGALAAVLLFCGLGAAWSWAHTSIAFGSALMGAYVIRELRLVRNTRGGK